LLEWDQLSAADDLLREAEDLEAPFGNVAVTTKGQSFLVRARLRLAEDRADQALEALSRATADALRVESQSMRDLITAFAMRVRLRQGDFRVVTAWSEDVSHDADDLLQYRHEAQVLSAVRIWLARGESSRAAHLLEGLKTGAERDGRISSFVEVLSLQARAEWASGARDRAVNVLAHALAAAETGGYTRLFVDEGEQLVPLLAELAAAQRPGRLIPPSPKYVRTVLAAAGGSAAVPGGSSPTDRTNGPYQTLSRRELEVLRLMATGASNERIAAELVVGVTTVKTHINGIFRKLGASNRLDAVTRARHAGLLDGTGSTTG
jgi:LuxR family maltose regulon positive regulatory protein